MARQRDGRKLAALTGSHGRHRRARAGPGAGAGAGASSGPRRIAQDVPAGRPDPSPFPSDRATDPSVRMSGTCSCGRERTDVLVPGAAGTRWFRNVFTECECGQLLMLEIGGSTPARN